MTRIYLSSPHMSGLEWEFVQEAFNTNWIAPLGPHVDAFEQEFAELVGAKYAAALSSGTAAIHLALILAGVEPNDEVVVSTLTFSATVNPIAYLGARPVFVDSERTSWNMSPELLADLDADFIAHARKLATQSRDPAPHYQHSEIGYNYRMSNVLAAIGRGQLQVLEDRVQARRRNFEYYQQTIGDLPGIDFMPEAPWGRHTRWLTVITVEPALFGVPPAPNFGGEGCVSPRIGG